MELTFRQQMALVVAKSYMELAFKDGQKLVSEGHPDKFEDLMDKMPQVIWRITDAIVAAEEL